MKLYVIFYHPKNPLNLGDVLQLCRATGAQLIVVRRPGATYNTEEVVRGQAEIVDKLEEAVARIPDDATIILLETYALKPLSSCLEEVGETAAVLVGAEDYGVPRYEVDKLPRDRLLLCRIPMAVEGSSYNVASTVAMLLYEARRREHERKESQGRYHQ